MLQSFIKKKKIGEKFANVAEPANMAGFFTNVAEFAVLSNIAGSLRLCRCCNSFSKKKKMKNGKKKKCNVAEPTVMAELSNVAVLPMLQILQYLQILQSVAEFYKKKKKVGSLQMLQNLRM